VFLLVNLNFILGLIIGQFVIR